MFHRSSMDIHLRDGHVLCAYCKRPSGEATYSELDLDRFLGVKKGRFAWGARDFSGSATGIFLDQTGPLHEPILHAQLDDGYGPHTEHVNLMECIKNQNGTLTYMDCF
ncbi:hypothetical protein PENDEC_c001G02778 [Penicillium decumbens]|uniref:Cyanovirin-N domain-containing protein n=1 Tax=Penicillium decumbens TaxID=69771 RepID=A0A1V6PML6_PENDC|nr:hypothetical protein PENDEC_c001G02778 [Penicillium decumbens]